MPSNTTGSENNKIGRTGAAESSSLIEGFGDIVIRPRKFLSTRGSYGGMKSDILWVQITPYKLLEIRDWNMKYASSIEASRADEWPQYEFALMNKTEFTLKHEWKKFDTIGGVGKDIASKFNKSLQATGEAGVGIGPQGSKTDSPLLYDDTDRRTHTLQFQFIDEGNPETDVFLVVQDFLEMTSPKDSSGDTMDVKFDYPYIFGIQTFSYVNGNKIPNSVINYKYAAIQSVQYTYNAPYRNGFPTTADMTLTIEDMYPTYRDSFAFGSSTTVSVSVGGAGGGQ